MLGSGAFARPFCSLGRSPNARRSNAITCHCCWPIVDPSFTHVPIQTCNPTHFVYYMYSTISNTLSHAHVFPMDLHNETRPPPRTHTRTHTHVESPVSLPASSIDARCGWRQSEEEGRHPPPSAAWRPEARGGRDHCGALAMHVSLASICSAACLARKKTEQGSTGELLLLLDGPAAGRTLYRLPQRFLWIAEER